MTLKVTAMIFKSYLENIISRIRIEIIAIALAACHITFILFNSPSPTSIRKKGIVHPLYYIQQIPFIQLELLL